MCSSSLFLFFFLVFYLLLLHNIAESSTCPTSFNCQGLGSLRFPLSNNDPNCGLFMVNCTHSSHPLIQLRAGGNWYEILGNTTSSRFLLHDPVLQNLLTNVNCFSFGNLSLPASPSASFTITPSLTLYSCINGSEDGVFRNDNFETHDCRDFHVFYRNPTTGSALNESNINPPTGCQVIQMPIDPEQDLSNPDPDNFFQLFSANFTLEWTITGECIRCHDRGGQCSTNNMNGFLCKMEQRGNRTNLILATAIPGCVFLLLICGAFVFWVCKRRINNAYVISRNISSEPSSKSDIEAGSFYYGIPIFCYTELEEATNNFDPSKELGDGGFGTVYHENGRLSFWTIIGIVLGAILTIILVVVILWWKGRCSQRKDTLEYELRGTKFRTSSFTYQQIKTATNSFNPANKIGEGGFGPVYKGKLSDGTVVAVKQLSSKSRQGNREFVTEIGMISALRHPNLVKLYGCCVEGNNLLLIYEYMENNSLARALFGSEDYKLNMDWPTRHKICVGVARGLAFLHEESAMKIVHRDIKASNVLLDGNLIPKISDFGLTKLHEEDDTHISTRIAGTLGYMAPEYAMEGYLTEKADVYSFGVVLLEVVSGRTNNTRPGEEFNLLGQAKFLCQTDNLMELVDPRLESHCNKEEILATINIALTCTNFVGAERPSMLTVVSMLTSLLYT